MTSSWNTPTPGDRDGGRAALYLEFLRTELKPRIDRAYRTLAAARETGIMGSSLGGLLAAFAACAEPASWGFAGVVSPSTWWDGRYILSLVPDLAAAAPRPARVYIDSVRLHAAGV